MSNMRCTYTMVKGSGGNKESKGANKDIDEDFGVSVLSTFVPS